MMGKDVERIVHYIENIRDAAQAGIISLSSATAYQLISRAQHAGTAFGLCEPEEKEKPDGDPMGPVSSAMSALSEDVKKMDYLNDGLYVSSSEFNNQIASPWNELNKLQACVNAGAAYSGAHAPFNYVGEKAGMLALLNMIMTAAVDTKWAMTVYHDYIQRGYDNQFNNNIPSVKFPSGITSDRSTGNVVQEFYENVNINEPSIDPF